MTLLLASFSGVSAQGSIEEPPVRIEVRTLGWGLQGTFAAEGLTDSLKVHVSQFSAPVLYVGPPTLVLYTVAGGMDEFEQRLEAVDRGGAPPTPVATVRFPEGSQRVLLFFARDSGSNNRLRVAVLDDSLTRTEEKNVQFYNLTPLELYVQAFDRVERIAPGRQAIWHLDDAEDRSSLAIAVRNPKDSVLYASRFRLRPSERMVFFARLAEPLGAGSAADVPRIIVTPVSMSITPPMVIEQEANQDIGTIE